MVAEVVHVLPDGPPVDKDVQVPDDLPGHEDGLCLRDLVRPELAGDLERGAGPTGDERSDPVEAVGMESEPLVQ